MNKSLLLYAVCAASGSLPAFAQQATEGHYGRQRLDVAYAAAATNDGGYIITGLTKSMADTTGDIVVIKTGPHGDTLWSRTYGGPNVEGGNFVMQAADGGYIVAGHTEDFGARDCDAFLMKLDQYGNNQWIKTYGGDSDDISYSVAAVDGGYVIGGMTISYGNVPVSTREHIYFIKTDNNGDTLWTRVYAGAGNEECFSITAMPGGNLLAAGYTSSRGGGEEDGLLMCLNANGDTLWTKLWRNAGDTRFAKVLPTLDSGYIVAGNTTLTTGGMVQGFAVKLDAAGHEQWTRTYGDAAANISFHDVAQLPTGNFIFAGTSYATPVTGYVYALVADADGNMISDEQYGGTNSYAYAIAAQGNDSYLIAGGAAKYGDPDGDLYYMEMDNTISAHVAATPNSGGPLRLYPDPVGTQPAIIILPSAAAYQPVSLNVMTIDGKPVLTRDNIPAKDITIDRKHFASGMYLFRITCSDGAVYKGKFVVE